MFVISLCSNLIIFLLVAMTIILITNLLMRPVLWTYFNVCMITYYSLNVVLGSFNIHLLSSIMGEYLDLAETQG